MNLQSKFEIVFSKNTIFSTFLNKNEYFLKYCYPTFNSNSLNILEKYKNYQKMNILMISNSNDRKECQTFYQNTTDLLKEFKDELKDIFCLLHICNDSKLLDEVNQNFDEYYDILNKKEKQMENKLLTSIEIWSLIDNQYFLDIYNTIFDNHILSDLSTSEPIVETKIEKDTVSSFFKSNKSEIQNKKEEKEFEDYFEPEFNSDFEIDEKYSTLVDQYVDTLIPASDYYSTPIKRSKKEKVKSVNGNTSEYERRYTILKAKSLQELKHLVETIGEVVYSENKSDYIEKCISVDWLF
jgi:hypothetical protein